MIETEQFEEVLQIRMGREFDGKIRFCTTAYLVDDLLVDTGCAHTAMELAEFLEGRAIHMAINTHYHEDHIGANHILLERGIMICASRESIPRICEAPEMYEIRELAWGTPVPTEVSPVSSRIDTAEYSFEVVETPGHCRGHVALVERVKGWCFSGDLLVVAEPTVFRPVEEDLGQTLRSMQNIVDLESQRLVLFTASGSIIEDGRAALRACIDYYRYLAMRTKEMGRRGFSVRDIVERLFGGESRVAEVTHGDMSSEHLVRALLASDL